MTGHRMIAPTIRRRLVREDGVTLTEMLMVLAILGIVLGGMTTLFVSASTSQIDQSNRVQAQQNARLALDALRREIHCASAITPDSIPTGTASITLTLGPYCSNGGTTLSTTKTILATGLANETVGAADTSAYLATAGKFYIYIGPSSGTITCTANPAPSFTSFTGCTGGVEGSYPAGSAVTAITTITWCTKEAPIPAAAGSRYSLWRYRGASCSGTGRQWADYLTTTTAVTAGKVFTGYTAPVTGDRRALTVTLPVDVTPGDAKQRYTLRDDIVLRNSLR